MIGEWRNPVLSGFHADPSVFRKHFYVYTDDSNGESAVVPFPGFVDFVLEALSFPDMVDSFLESLTLLLKTATTQRGTPLQN